MRILFVTDRFPHPLDTGGNIRSFHLIKGLAEEHDVVLLSTSAGGVPDESLAVMRGICKEVHVAPAAGSRMLRDAVQLARGPFTDKPLVLRRHESGALRRKMREILRGSARIDALHFNHLDTALYDDEAPAGTLKVLDQHNVVSNQVATTLLTERRFPRRFLLERDYEGLLQYEARACNAMDLCFACSEADADTLQKLGVVERPRVIPNGVDLDYFQPRPAAPPVQSRIVFFGTLDYDPCERGVWHFCTEILPLIRAQVPNATFTAVGRNPSRRLLALAAERPEIQFTGRVDDIRIPVQAASVSVVPLLSGSGTRLKILEAMAMGVPVISTAIGIEGITARDGEHALIRDEGAAFAAATVQVLRDAGMADALSRAGRRFVEAHFGWPAIRAQMRAAYSEASCSAR